MMYIWKNCNQRMTELTEISVLRPPAPPIASLRGVSAANDEAILQTRYFADIVRLLRYARNDVHTRSVPPLPPRHPSAGWGPALKKAYTCFLVGRAWVWSLHAANPRPPREIGGRGLGSIAASAASRNVVGRLLLCPKCVLSLRSLPTPALASPQR